MARKPALFLPPSCSNKDCGSSIIAVSSQCDHSKCITVPEAGVSVTAALAPDQMCLHPPLHSRRNRFLMRGARISSDGIRANMVCCGGALKRQHAEREAGYVNIS